jgi:hypothetical protein
LYIIIDNLIYKYKSEPYDAECDVSKSKLDFKVLYDVFKVKNSNFIALFKKENYKYLKIDTFHYNVITKGFSN